MCFFLIGVSCAKRCAIILLMIILTPAWGKLTPEQHESKNKGLIFYNLDRQDLAAPLLQTAAISGDSESQYYIGEIERHKSMFMTAVAQQWYEKAAEQGDIYAMLRLASADQTLCILMQNCAPDIKSPSEWAVKAGELIRARANQGDGEAMFQLYLLTSNFDWLIKSAKNGFPEGQNWLGVKYRERSGFFLTPDRRKKEVERLFRAASNAGYVPAMRNLYNFIPLEGNEKEVGYWVEKAAQSGHFGAMSSYAAWTAHLPDEVGYPMDLVKAYGLTLLMAEAEPGGGWKSYGEEALIKVAAKMTVEQIEAGKAFAEEWKKTHPPLPRFLPKYGF